MPDMAGRNPKHDNIQAEYCFPPEFLLCKFEMRPSLLTLKLVSSCSCSVRARRRSLRPPSLVSQVPISGDGSVVVPVEDDFAEH